MLHDNDKQLLKRYKHLVACLIDSSCGYFTPLSALMAILAHKRREPYYCELYMDIVWKQRKCVTQGEYPADETEHYKTVNRDYIKNALRFFKMPSHTVCLAIVDRNIRGNESVGASWF